MRSMIRTISTVRNYAFLSLAGILASCGSSSSDSAGTDKYVGTWKFTSGTITVTCPDPIGTITVAESGNVIVNKGSTSDLIVTTDQCSLKFDVTNGTATAVAGQSCTMVDTDGTEVDSYNNAVITSPDGVTAHFSANITAAITASGLSVTCTGTESSDLIKL
jgi:hypothetical protein